MTASALVKLYGTPWCGHSAWVRRALEQAGISHQWIDISRDPEAAAWVESVSAGQQRVPVLLFPDGDILVEPSPAVLNAKLAGMEGGGR
jgi:mycoredoxin